MDLRGRCVGQLSDGAHIVLRESGQLACIDRCRDVWIWNGRLSSRSDPLRTELVSGVGPIALQAVLDSFSERSRYAAAVAAVKRLSGDVTVRESLGQSVASERLAMVHKQLGPDDYAIALDLVIHKRVIVHFTSAQDQFPADTIARLRRVVVDLADAYGLMPVQVSRCVDQP